MWSNTVIKHQRVAANARPDAQARRRKVLVLDIYLITQTDKKQLPVFVFYPKTQVFGIVIGMVELKEGSNGLGSIGLLPRDDR